MWFGIVRHYLNRKKQKEGGRKRKHLIFINPACVQKGSKEGT
jgi:hypothetical protein